VDATDGRRLSKWIFSHLQLSGIPRGVIANSKLTILMRRGTPSGQDIKVDKFDAYLAIPSTSTIHQDVGIILFTDVIGIWQNSKLMADQYASRGYLTLIIDIFNGDSLTINRPDGWDFMTWLTKGSTGDNPHTPAYIDPIVDTAISYMRDTWGVKRLGGAGYCFGAKV
jgi:dienelactone hydrolase